MIWQPISTLPADDQRVLLWCTELGDDRKGGVTFGRRTLRGNVRGEGMLGEWVFTHWTPLPPPPAEG